MRRKRDSSYEMGVKAAMRGEGEHRNPFPAKITAHEDWLIGWKYFNSSLEDYFS